MRRPYYRPVAYGWIDTAIARSIPPVMNRKGIKKILILSIWEDLWSLGEGCGVPDEMHFIEGLAKRGAEVYYLMPETGSAGGTPSGGGMKRYTYPNIFRTFSRLPGPISRLLIAITFPLIITRRIISIASEINPDLILGFSHQSIQPVSRAGRILGITTAVKLFGVMQLGRRDISPAAYLYNNFDQINSLRYPVDRYIVLNDGTLGRDALLRRGIPDWKITFLQNGMDLEWADVEVDRGEVRRSMGLPEDAILVISLSRFVKLKRIGHLLEIAALLDEESGGETIFVLAGDGPRKAHLVRMAESLEVADRVVFTGAVSYERVPEILKASDIFAATGMLTNMSMPSCEAMICGLPVIAYDVAGTSEVVRDEKTGLLVRDGDKSSFSSALKRLIGDEKLRRGLGVEARRFALENFVNWGRRIEEEIDSLEKTVAEYVAGGRADSGRH